MRFHDYVAARARGLAQIEEAGGYSQEFINRIRQMNSAEVAQYLLDTNKKGLAAEFGLIEKAFFKGSEASIRTALFLAEFTWHAQRRPFYNVWPIANSLLSSVSLNIQWGEIVFPQEVILFRFPKGHEPHGLACALIQEQSREITVVYQAADSPHHIQTVLPSNFGDKEPIEDSLVRIRRTWVKVGAEKDTKDTLAVTELFRSRVEFLYRLAAFTSLLAKGQDLITPLVLAKDQDKYDAADENTKRWLEDRAARIQGRGFDIGKQLEAERDRTPHWRNPHLCLFWTGEGRGKPLLKVRRGGVVIPKALSEVPTGFMGPESPEELKAAEAVYTRIPIAARLRFEILRRDSYRCQLCGCTQSEVVRLHIDHKVAVSKGGSTTEDNLWVLCEPCNLGKSDLDI